MLTSYTNSILPNNYIDIYMSTKDNGKADVYYKFNEEKCRKTN